MASSGSVPSVEKNIPTSVLPVPATSLYSPFASVSTFPESPPHFVFSAASNIAAMAPGPNRTSALVPILPAMDHSIRMPYITASP